LYQFHQHTIYSDTDFYIPHRYREGYGVSKLGIDFAKENGFTLIISLDCGIKSVELIAYAKTLGIDFIVCDHHLPDKELPDGGCYFKSETVRLQYPYKELCGCGVGFKLMMALGRPTGSAGRKLSQLSRPCCYRYCRRYRSYYRREQNTCFLWFEKSK
jgi:single-stranded-DNA-specific exonuclease